MSSIPNSASARETGFADWNETIGRALFPIGELDQGRFFLGMNEHSEIYLVADWIATFGPLNETLKNLVLGVRPRTNATS